jgi:hypothetical protein
MKSTDSFSNRFDLKELVWTIGYRLTAYVGNTNVQTVKEWLKSGLPENLEERMKAVFDVAKPIEQAESEYAAQAFLWGNLDAIPIPESPATLLREAVNIQAARTELMELAKKEFLENAASNLEDLERRLKEWSSRAKMPPHTLYKVGLSTDRKRLWLTLLHAGISLEQQRKWDRGEDWPLWTELIAAVPEMAKARTSPDLQTSCPFRYLRHSINESS